jgi:prepilin-type N-terminal cleavage/methylation domain-containing protein
VQALRQDESGFTLIEVLVASAIFVGVALAGFEMFRQLGATVIQLATRADAAAQLSLAESDLRSAALSAVAVFAPPSTCGAAVEFLKRDAGGTSFQLFALRPNASNGRELVEATAPGPLDPCAAATVVTPIVAQINALTVTTFHATQLAAHADPVSGQNDGGMLVASGVTAVAVDAHVRNLDGSAITSGNDVVEVRIDADPVVTIVDLVAGNRPSAYTQQLAYTCGGRCEANGPFGELRGGAYTDCVATLDFANGPAYYVPAVYGFRTLPSGRRQTIVTAYAVTGAYLFAFAGPTPLTVARTWPTAQWPPAGSALAGTIADPYPVNYVTNAVATRGAGGIATDLGEPVAYAAELTACADLHAESGVLFHG